MNKPLLIFLLIVISFSTHANDAKKGDLLWVERLYLMSAIRTVSPVIKNACLDKRILCRDTDQRELAISYIGMQKSKMSKLSLTSLMRFKLDGSGGEIYQCYILDGDEELTSLLKAIKAKELVKQCKNEFNLISGKEEFGKISSDMVCATESEISKNKKQLLTAIEAGRKCNDDTN